MRVAYVSADRGIPVFGTKGASIHIREMVNAFAELGCDVTLVVARRGPQTCPISAEIVKVTTEAANGTSAMSPLEGEEKARSRERYSLAVSDVIRDRLIELHRENPFDCIYERYGLFSTAGVRAARTLGIPCVVEVNSPLLMEQQKFRKLVHLKEAEAVETEVFVNADALLPVSEQVCTYVKSKGAEGSRTYVVPNAVDVRRFHPEVEAEPTAGVDGKFIVGFVGSLKPWHGIDVLLEAFRSIARLNDCYHLLIVGDGPLRSWIEGFVRGAGIDSQVTITGWVAHESLPGLIRSMAVAVAPYPELEDFYFSPLKLYEYMAVGRPVVASRIGQIENVINDGHNGLLVQPGHPEELARCIDQLFHSPTLQHALGQAARASMVDRTWLNNARQVVNIVPPLLRPVRSVA